jgi:hypothetical protein
MNLTVVNAGAAGATVAQMKSTYEASWHHAGASARCVLQSGGQDILVNGSSAASTYTTAAALLDEMRGDGCKPVVVLPTPAALSSGWTVPRQSEYDIYRLSLQAYCTTNSATTTCVDTYAMLGDTFTYSIPSLAAGNDNGTHFALTQTGANALANGVYYAIVQGTSLYSGSSSTTTTNPLSPSANAYCLVATEAPNPSWDNYVSAGLISFGPFNTANSVNFYRFNSNTTNAGGWAVWMFNNVGAGTNLFATGLYPVGFARDSSAKVAFCANNGQGTFWVDGVNTSGPSAIPTAISLNSTLYTGNNAYGGVANTFLTACIAGPTGTVSADVRVAVQNSCGQFTPNVTLPVEGGVVPVSGARVVAIFGDSITRMGASAVRPYPQKLNALLGTGYNVINEGVGGWNVSQMKARYDAIYHGQGSINRCLFLGGINDIFNGTSAAATYSTASALLDEMRADGCRPIVVMPTPAKNTTVDLGWSSGMQTQYDAYRSDLSGYCTTNSATTTCVDTYGAGPSSGLGDGTSPPQLYSAFDNGDHTHPYQAGEDLIATLINSGATWP